MLQLHQPVSRRASTATADPAPRSTSAARVVLARKPTSVALTSALAHVAGADGLCAGCLDLARLALVPCPIARSASPANGGERDTADDRASPG
ncbi:MAG: hypothetical protein QOE61_4164 [Micromonosporaceae bacterium]|jgi:hypothetical protein|nr:hypothetical protein [Micromonosporaceae bacterium]